MLIIEDLSVTAGEKKIIDKFSYRFEKNKIYAIMGPNGAGKSTLALAMMGHPAYKVKGEIRFEGKNILSLSADKRAKLGLFLSFQSPLMLDGVSVFQLLRKTLAGKIEPLALKNKIEAVAQELQLNKNLLYRPLNEGASGGERKKLEFLQAIILDPKLLILDEIDTGVDVDSLKTITLYLNKIKKDRITILITHYHRILNYLNPDRVLVIINGKLAKEGGLNLARMIEEKGYHSIGE